MIPPAKVIPYITILLATAVFNVQLKRARFSYSTWLSQSRLLASVEEVITLAIPGGLRFHLTLKS